MTIYTGDILLQETADGNFDTVFENGQPIFTQGLETYVLLAVFGEDNWQNAIVKTESEKMKSTFPAVIKRNVVNDKTKNDGTEALKKALKPATDEKIAKTVKVTGEIISSNRIGWLIEIEALTDKSLKYFINWEKGALTASIVKG